MMLYSFGLCILFLLLVTAAAWYVASYTKWVFQYGSFAHRSSMAMLRILRIPSVEQRWADYLWAFIIFHALGLAVLWGILCFQSLWPFNPQLFKDVDSLLALHTAASFITNTNLQAYIPENTLSYFSQSAGLAVQNFLSAAGGTCIALVLVRGFARNATVTIGNFWDDLIRITLFILLPMAFIFAVFLISQGVPQNYLPYTEVAESAETYSIGQGPVASQIAIKMLGSNGGGYFAANAAHPYENPNWITNYAQLASILLLPISLVFLFGHMIGNMRQAWALYATMAVMIVLSLASVTYAEYLSPGWLAGKVSPDYVYEGKEFRFDITGNMLWSVLTTATSNGSANLAVASQNPLTHFIMLLQMQLGELIFGGVGAGLYTILLFAIIAIFMAGLMIGRTPEYLHKKIETLEIKAAVLAFLVIPLVTFAGLSLVLLLPESRGYTLNSGTGGYTEILYALTSAAANNGSAMGGLQMNNPLMLSVTTTLMLLGRFLPILAVMMIAGNLAAKKKSIPSISTLQTDSITFVVMLVCVIMILGGLTYFPALVLGPVADFFNT